MMTTRHENLPTDGRTGLPVRRRRPVDWHAVVVALLGLFLVPHAQGQGQARMLTGITEPILDAVLAFPVTGVVSARAIEEGAAVRKGQVIVELDKQLEELEVERRRLAMRLAEAELERLRALASKNAISVSREETDKKEAEFGIAKVEHELAREMLRRRQLTSPTDGVVAQYFKQVGEACDQERTAVVRVVDTARCLFVLDCEPALAPRFVLGQAAKLQFDGAAGAFELEGKVHFVAPVVDAASGLLRVKILFNNPALRVRPGITGRLVLD